MTSLTLTPQEAAPLLEHTHGIVLDHPLIPLGSELASTFKGTAAGRSFAVKMQASSTRELPIQIWRAEVAAHLCALGQPVPQVLNARDGGLVGSASHEGASVAITVSDWIAAAPYGELGAALDTAGPDTAGPGTATFARNLGATAARLQQALQTAPHPPREVDHTWAAHTMQSVIADHLSRVTDPGTRRLAAAGIELLAAHVEPIAACLPRALVHQDLHDSNVLAHPSGTIAAVIDFDDMLVGWRVAEPAIAAAYLARHAAHPAQAVESVAAAWEEVIPFTPEERVAYSALVRARLALNATVWNAREGGDRDDYARMRSDGTARTFEALTASASALVAP